MSNSSPTRPEIESAIREEAEKHNLDAELLIRQCDAESSFNPDACNAKTGCYGLFQFAATTAKWLGVNRGDWHDNVRGGVLYMARLRNQYHGDYGKTLAAFDWGSGHLDRLIVDHPADWRDHLPTETKNYLARIIS